MLHTSAVPCWCVYMVRKHHCYFSFSFSTSKNMSGTLFVIWFLLHTLFGLFYGSLTCKYVTRLYVAAVKVLNRPDTVCFLVYKCRKSYRYLASCQIAFKNLNQTFFLTSKLLNTLAVHNFMHFNL